MKKLLASIVLGIALFFAWSGSAAATDKVIVINLSEQILRAYEDRKLLHRFVVSTGTQRTPTPNGGFWPWIKLRYDRMTGGSLSYGDYYDLPNVPYVVYFYNEVYPKHRGYALHGTYWHSNFGTPMSHGCINLRTSDMAQLYPWIDMQTVIIVTGETP